MASLHAPTDFRPRNTFQLEPVIPTANARFPAPDDDERIAPIYRPKPMLGPEVRKSQGRPHPPGGLKMSSGEWKLLGVVLLLASVVRLFRLNQPNSVVFDEVHFGKFASKYIKSQYYVDVHPPLAKLLITLAGFVSGYDGNFDFKDIGKQYEHVPYVAMRLLPATLGILLVPLSYLTLRALDCRTTTALLGALLVTFENGLITQSRHILLDSPLIFFTALTTFFWVGFANENRAKPFTDQWWTWLSLTGLSLGAVVSCKWVGLFTIATVGLSTIRQLWVLLGDVRIPIRLWIKHFLARALCLIAIPILFYMFMFEIHFLILSNSGDGDGFMSAEFQHTLNGRHMQDTYADVGLGSKVVIRHLNTNGGYLHSHDHAYPGGSRQQQITLYPHKDGNNEWRVLNATWEGHPEFDYLAQPFHALKHGAMIRLEHIVTTKKLHSHDVRPPVSEVDFQNEVSGYGFPGFAGDANDNWVVEIDTGDRRDPASATRVRTLRTKFRLRHVLTGCYLFSHKVKLPDWGFEQQEVTCNKNAVKANSLWYVETNTHDMLPITADHVNYRRPGFLSKFLELQRIMWNTNAGLTDRHAFDSRPNAWPVLRRGINFWVKDHRQIYLIGNPLVWWLSTAAVVAYVSARALLILRAKRGYKDFNNSGLVYYDQLCGFLLLGWALHYFPFYLMSRQLFLHHYFPALYFAILMSCAVFDLATARLSPRVRVQVAGVVLLGVVWAYAHFSPLAYANKWTSAKCQSSKWLKTWDFACNDFPQKYSDYSASVTAVQPTQAVTNVVNELPHQNIGKAPDLPADDAQPQTTQAAGNAPEPGRDIFQDHPDAQQVNSATSSLPPPAEGVMMKEPSLPQTSEAAREEEAQTEAPASEAPPPLPLNEPAEMSSSVMESSAAAEETSSPSAVEEAPSPSAVEETPSPSALEETSSLSSEDVASESSSTLD